MEPKSIVIYVNDVFLGAMACDTVQIEKDSYLYGGEEKYCYNVTISIGNQFVFYTADKKEIYKQGNKLFIYEFER